MGNYSADIKTARMTAIVTGIDAGAGPGVLEIYTAAFGTLLASLTLQKPSWTVDGDHLDLNGAPADVDADASGTAAVARIKDSNGNIKINNMTVGVGGSFEVQVNSTNVVQHLAVTISGGTITHAA